MFNGTYFSVLRNKRFLYFYVMKTQVDLTWDETDPLRKELTDRVFDPKEKVDDEDIRAYLASSSESEAEEEKGYSLFLKK